MLEIFCGVNTLKEFKAAGNDCVQGTLPPLLSPR